MLGSDRIKPIRSKQFAEIRKIFEENAVGDEELRQILSSRGKNMLVKQVRRERLMLVAIPENANKCSYLLLEALRLFGPLHIYSEAVATLTSLRGIKGEEVFACIDTLIKNDQLVDDFTDSIIYLPEQAPAYLK